MSRQPLQKTKSAGIEYLGDESAPEPCAEAVKMLLLYGKTITRARILTEGNSHGILLNLGEHRYIAIKSGFASGYIGGGPHGLSYVLMLLQAHDVDIEEHEVPAALLARVNQSALTERDVATIERMQPLRPSRWPKYVWETT